EEAVEICKLRLFLKLVAQVERVEQIEPLPDIDFNIRAGNTLVGYATAEDVRKAFHEKKVGAAVQHKLLLGSAAEEYEQFQEDLELADRAFVQFRAQQTTHGGRITHRDKQELRRRLETLTAQLDRFLAGEYGVDPHKPQAFEAWKASHQPFHWFAEFYGIMRNGGFDVIIGNPPYLEIRQVEYAPRWFRTYESAAVHAMCIERSLCILQASGKISMIVPLALVSTQRMTLVQHLLEAHAYTWYANFAWRPGKLFDTVNRALTIFVVCRGSNERVYSTNYQKWNSDTRSDLIPALVYCEVMRRRPAFWVPKLCCSLEQDILSKLLAVETRMSNFMKRSAHLIYYRTTGGLYWKVFTDFAPEFRCNGKRSQSSRETTLSVAHSKYVKSCVAILSSNLFWWWYTITSNLRDLNPSDIQGFPVPESALSDEQMQILGENYLRDLQQNSTMLVRHQKQTGKTETQCFKILKSKPIIDEIDRVLARHYGFTDEELDFIINYDIKYRMGSDAAEDEE
ncbi:Eco57I restriction-modification methylase domain-containing protein, partial [Roseiflexus sp.]